MSFIKTTQEYKLEEVDFSLISSADEKQTLSGNGYIAKCKAVVHKDDVTGNSFSTITIESQTFFVEQLQELVDKANKLTKQINGE